MTEGRIKAEEGRSGSRGEKAEQGKGGQMSETEKEETLKFIKCVNV